VDRGFVRSFEEDRAEREKTVGASRIAVGPYRAFSEFEAATISTKAYRT